MAKGDTWRVTCDYLHVRSGPSTVYGACGGLSKNQEVTEIATDYDSKSNLWVKHSMGWSCTTGYMRKVHGAAVEEITENSQGSTGESSNNTTSGYQPTEADIMSQENVSVAQSDFVKIKHVSGVFGLPYQFLPAADIRLSGDEETENIGYEYGEKIIERIPLLFISPGRANFMNSFSKEDRKSVIEKIVTMNSGINTAGLEDLLDSNGRYYSFEYDNVRYYNFVNPMCRLAAQFLGIGDQQVNGVRLDMMSWQDYTDTGLQAIADFGNFRSIPFYIDTDTSISESFSNNTTQSTLASTVNSISDMGRELNFLLGYTVGDNLDSAMQDETITKSIESVDNIVSRLLGGTNFLKNITRHLTSVATGGKLIFPEIWSDSQFSRSYSCEIKLIAPDPSKLSIYMNVLVPLFHLIGLVAPQSIENNPNAYGNPFIIRAIYKGFFNVDMGIITSMSVSKGAECQWSPEGIPTSITVSIDIKDLYSALSITSTGNDGDWSYDTMSNTALMDYIANLCGVNVYKPEITRLIEMWLMNKGVNRVQDLFKNNIWGGLQDWVQNKIFGIYR